MSQPWFCLLDGSMIGLKNSKAKYHPKYLALLSNQSEHLKSFLRRTKTNWHICYPYYLTPIIADASTLQSRRWTVNVTTWKECLVIYTVAHNDLDPYQNLPQVCFVRRKTALSEAKPSFITTIICRNETLAIVVKIRQK